MNGTVTRTLALVAALAVGLGGCATTTSDGPDARSSALTPGGVKMTIVKGKTTQADCMEAFGTPDLITHRDGRYIWTYDKTTYDYEKRSDYLTVIFAGSGGDRVRSSSSSTMLIIYFDENEVVQDYRLSAVKF